MINVLPTISYSTIQPKIVYLLSKNLMCTHFKLLSFLILTLTCLVVLGCDAIATGPTGPGMQYPQQPPLDIRPDESHPPYNTKPASSGWHYFTRPTWGIHQDFIADELLVHNLEHGGIGIHYDCPDGCPELINKLQIITLQNDKIVMSPYPEMETRIALTAWTFIDRFEEFDESRIMAFINAHVNSPTAPMHKYDPLEKTLSQQE